jgi:hypothetical protein
VLNSAEVGMRFFGGENEWEESSVNHVGPPPCPCYPTSIASNTAELGLAKKKDDGFKKKKNLLGSAKPTFSRWSSSHFRYISSLPFILLDGPFLVAQVQQSSAPEKDSISKG